MSAPAKARTPEIVQCPQGCGRLVRWGVARGTRSEMWCNASGAWAGFGHMCGFDGADERGDNDDSASRDEELARCIECERTYPAGTGRLLTCGSRTCLRARLSEEDDR